MTTTAPFAAKSISCRLYPHNELDAPSIVREVCAQGKLALDGGFDGIMTSEHHGGFAGYMPLPLQMVSFILEDTKTAGSACHFVPLRPTAMVAGRLHGSMPGIPPVVSVWDRARSSSTQHEGAAAETRLRVQTGPEVVAIVAGENGASSSVTSVPAMQKSPFPC